MLARVRLSWGSGHPVSYRAQWPATWAQGGSDWPNFRGRADCSGTSCDTGMAGQMQCPDRFGNIPISVRCRMPIGYNWCCLGGPGFQNETVVAVNAAPSLENVGKTMRGRLP
ncbi:hypothetical protein CLV78_102300 [Aliiruegeria haliotis]|uniref:Uncharacterized protein n=1 Tax=Aliiruegeria haliotis TaxID=1280846 RepID=A0A2T0RVP2_9RHOB|nr:hypothetical protein CLV78_102300 [Aliiruegeria haliotis]